MGRVFDLGGVSRWLNEVSEWGLGMCEEMRKKSGPNQPNSIMYTHMNKAETMACFKLD